MRVLVAVDPGKFHAGWCRFRGLRLIAAGIVRDLPTPWDVAYAVAEASELESADIVVSESQQAYARGPGNPNDLIPLAYASGGVLALAQPTAIRKNPLPRQWKGSTEKKIWTARIEAALAPYELAIIDAIGTTKKYRTDVLDAAGLGLWALGRKI